MVIAVQFVTTVFIAALLTLFASRSRTTLGRGVLLGIVANAVAFLIVALPMGKNVYGVRPTATFLVKYALLILSVGAAGIVILGLLSGFLRLKTKDDPWRWWNVLISLGGAIIAALAGLFYLLPRWLQQAVGEIPQDPNFVVMLTIGKDETTDVQDLSILNELVAPVIILAIVGALVGFIRSDIEIKGKLTRRRVRFCYVRSASFVALLGIFTATFSFASAQMPIAAAAEQLFKTSSYVEDNYVEPTADVLSLPEEKRNLVHIYMESIENSYYSQDLGGYMDQNLMPELARLSKTGISFSDTDVHGGPEQLYATGHSVAGMISMQAGIPMLASGASGSQYSYPGFQTIGDILKDEGYVNQFFRAASGEWSGIADYYRRHGDFDVWDYERFISEGLVPEDYKVWWGVEDDKLYEFAKQNLTELGSGDDPFYMIIENADTHFPDGFVSPNMTEAPFDQQYANVIHYSQAQTVKLIEWIQAQPWYENTTIVVTGDHRSMDKEFFKDWDPSYNRTVVNFILNPAIDEDLPDSVTKNRQWATIDMFPTILFAMGAQIEGDRLGMGTNMFSGKQTLVERDGAEFMNEQFVMRSPFYDKNRETRSLAPDSRQDNKF